MDALLIEQQANVGDVWRNRYNCLTLHNKIEANIYPYLDYPQTWPVWLPKDMMGMWLEQYAQAMELNIWTSTRLISADYDDGAKTWNVRLNKDGFEQSVQCSHLVLATGISGGVPKRPALPGMAAFGGAILHSGEFTRGSDWQGKRALVIGTGNSGHDIAQDLYVSGAQSVAIMQRGPTCVISLSPGAELSYAIFSQGLPIEDVDLMIAAQPYDSLIESFQWITKKTEILDRELLDGLHTIGFKTHTGEDQTGYQLFYLRGVGGYYINVGCSDLLIQRKIGLVQHDDIDAFEKDGLRLSDGTLLPLDLVVMATGFESMQETIRSLLGDRVADKVGPVWGFDEDHNMRNMWTRTGQDGLWLMGGSMVEARINSRYLALQIRAALDGLLPPR